MVLRCQADWIGSDFELAGRAGWDDGERVREVDAVGAGSVLVYARVYSVSIYAFIWSSSDWVRRCERSYMVSRDDYNDPSTKEFRCAMPDCVSNMHSRRYTALTSCIGPHMVQVVLDDHRERTYAHVRRKRRTHPPDGKRRLEDVSRYVIIPSSRARLTRSHRMSDAD